MPGNEQLQISPPPNNRVNKQVWKPCGTFELTNEQGLEFIHGPAFMVSEENNKIGF